MAYRAAATRDAPRTMTLHTQRGPTAVVTGLIGVALLLAAIVVPLASEDHKRWIATMILAPCGLLLAGMGADTYVTRATLEVDDATGRVVLTVRSLLGRKVYSFDISEVRGVLVETDEESRRLAIDTVDERIPLSGLLTTEDLEARAQRIRDFLGTK